MKTIGHCLLVLLILACGCRSEHANCKSGLETRVYTVERWFVKSQLNEITTSNNVDDVININTNRAPTITPVVFVEAMTNLLGGAGISFPMGAFITMDTNTLTMTIRNTRENIDEIERILVPLDGGKSCIG